MSVDLNLPVVVNQSKLRSLIFRKIHTEIQAAVNDIQNQLDISLTPPTGSEVTNARDYHSVLRDRLRSASQLAGPCIVSGGLVAQQTIPNMTVSITAGEAIINGVACKWAAQNSGTITAPAISRYDVVVVNSDSSISIVSGASSADPVLPSVTSSRRAVAIIYLTSATTAITNSMLRDIREQGVTIDGKWFWTIQEAVTYTESGRDMAYPEGRAGGNVYIRPGHYYEKVTIRNPASGASVVKNLSLIFDEDAHMYRINDSSPCIYISGAGIPVAGLWCKGVTVYAGNFHGNGKAGQEGLIVVRWSNGIRLERNVTDGNTSSTGYGIGYGRDLYIKRVLNLHISNTYLRDRYWDQTGSVGPVQWDYGPSDPENYSTDSYTHDAGELPIGAVTYWLSMATSPAGNPLGIPYGFERAGNAPGETVSDRGSIMYGLVKPYLADPNYPALITICRVK